MVKSLHDQGLSAGVESRLGSPLRNASLIGHVPLVRTLLEWGEAIDACGKHGRSSQPKTSTVSYPLPRSLPLARTRPIPGLLRRLGGHCPPSRDRIQAQCLPRRARWRTSMSRQRHGPSASVKLVAVCQAIFMSAAEGEMLEFSVRYCLSTGFRTARGLPLQASDEQGNPLVSIAAHHTLCTSLWSSSCWLSVPTLQR
jgi:hypothetical protein